MVGRTEEDKVAIQKARGLIAVTNVLGGILATAAVLLFTVAFSIAGAYGLHYLLSLME